MPAHAKSTFTFDRIRAIFFFGILGLLSLGMLYLFRPFAYPIFWAAVTAAVFYPMHKKIFVWTKKREGLSAFLSLSIITFIILIPLFTVSALVVNESVGLYQKISESGIFNSPQHVSSWLEGTPLAPYLDTIRTSWAENATKITQSVSTFLFNSLKNTAQVSAGVFIMTIIMLYTLYYFFKDGEKMLKKAGHLSPISGEYEDMLYERFTSTVRSTLKSTLIIGGIQGFLGGILFWITGIEGILIWSVIMIIVGILPALGPPLILVPASIIMFALGDFQACIILLIGTGIISVVDNVLRPMLVGRDTQMHPLIIFFSTLGGIVIFGVSGFVIGPVIAALYISVLSIYDHYYNKQLKDT
jgi:predicted PurR-regulated permease PerM